AVAPLFVTDTDTLAWFIAAWAGSGALAGLLLFAQHRVREVHISLAWLRYTWGFSWRYLISYVSTQGAALGAASGVGAIAGARALGGLQGAVLLVRPFMTFQVAAIAHSVGRVTRTLAEHSDALRSYVAKITVLTGGIAIANAAIILVLPDGLGRAVLGDSWDAAEPLLLPTGAQVVCLGSMTGVRAGLLGLRAIRKVMVIDIATTVVVLVGTIAGAAIDGAEGALWAIAIGQALLLVAWWLTFLSHTRPTTPPHPDAQFPQAPVLRPAQPQERAP
ncbi:MAG TPA: hypothetical protein VFZ89_11250, partial [Solirubrobacteraceae bacterium]